MPRGNPTINIGISSDIDKFIKELKGELKTLGDQGVDLGLADSVKAEINEIDKMLDGLQKTMKTITGSKLNSSTFSKFQSQIGQQLEALDKRTTALETGMNGLIDTMSKANGSKLQSVMDGIRQSMSETLDTTEKLTSAIGTVVDSANKNDNINVVSKEQTDELKETLNILKDIQNIQGEKTPQSWENTRKEVEKLSLSYIELKNQLKNFAINSKEYDDIQRELADTMVALKGWEQDIYETFSEDQIDNILDKSIKGLGKAPQAILSEIDKTASSMISSLQSRIDEINKVVGNTIKEVKSDNGDIKGFSIPVNIKTTPKTLMTNVVRLIEEVRPLIADQNLEVGISLVTDWGNRQQKKLLKDFQEKIGSIVETSDSLEIKAVYDDITKYFNDEIELKIKSDIDIVSDKIIKKIADIRKKIKEDPISLDFGSDDVKSTEKLFDNKILNGLDNLTDKLKEMQSVTKLTRSDLLKINSVLVELKFPNVASDVDMLDKSFANMQKKLSALNGSLKGKDAQSELRSILKAFKEYEALGGNKSFSDLSNQENIQNWFKTHINDKVELDADKYRSAGQQIGHEYALGIEDGLKDIVQACQKLVNTALKTIQVTQDSNSPSKKTRKLGNDFADGYINGIVERTSELENSIKDFVNQGTNGLQDFANSIAEYLDGKPKSQNTFFQDIAKNYSNVDDNIKEIIDDLGIVNAEQQLIKDGANNFGGIIGTDKTLIVKKQRDKETYQDIIVLKQKLDEAAAAGVKCSQILDVVEDKAGNIVVEVQNTMKGNPLSDADFTVNLDILQASDEQIKKIISDLKILWDLGLDPDIENPSNILYDLKSGFSNIDIGLHSDGLYAFKDFNDLLESFITTFRNQVDDIADISKAQAWTELSDRVENISKIIVDAATSSIATAQDSNSPSKVAKKLGNDLGDGYALGIKESIKQATDEAENLVDASINELSEAEAKFAQSGDLWNNRGLSETELKHELEVAQELNNLLGFDEELVKDINNAQDAVEVFTKAYQKLLDLFAKGDEVAMSHGMGSSEFQSILREIEKYTEIIGEQSDAVEQIENGVNKDAVFSHALEKYLKDLGLYEEYITSLKSKQDVLNPKELINEFNELLQVLPNITPGKELDEFFKNIGETGHYDVAHRIREIADQLEELGYVFEQSSGWNKPIFEHLVSNEAVDSIKSIKESIEEQERLTEEEINALTLTDRQRRNLEKEFGDSINNTGLSDAELQNELKIAQELVEGSIEEQNRYQEELEETINKAKEVQNAVNSIFQEPNTARYVHWGSKEQSKQILANPEGMSTGDYGQIQQFCDCLGEAEASSKAIEEYWDSTNGLLHQVSHNAGSALIIDIPLDQVKDFERGLKDFIPQEYIKGFVDTNNAVVTLNSSEQELLDTQNKINKTNVTTDKESVQLKEINQSAKKASQSKKDFAEANKEVLQSIINSLNGLNNEGKAFENLNKLINNLGGKNGDAKLKATSEGLKKIVESLSYPIEGNSFIEAIQKITESGANLGDISTILKASNKDLLQTVDTLNKASGIDLDDLLNTHTQEIIGNARAKLLELGGENSTFINISDIEKTKDGFLEIVGVIKTADDQLQEFTLHTKDGIEMQNVGMSENTARLAKQMKIYAQVEQFFDKMKEQGKMLANGAFFDPNVDPKTWEMLLAYAEEYKDYLGEIRSITMQTRQDKAGGALLESFSINGSNGSHLTVGPTGNIVASEQDVLGIENTIEKIQELIGERKKYNELVEKRLDNTATEQELADLSRYENKLAEVTTAVQRLNDIFGENEAAHYFEKLQASLTSDYNSQIIKFAKNAQNKINNALVSKNNQYTSFVKDFSSEIKIALTNIEELNDIIKNHPADTAWSDEERSAIKDMVNQIDGVTSELKDLENVYETVGSVDKLIGKISKDLNNNTAMSGRLKQSFNELRERIKTLRGDSNVSEESLSQIDKVTFKKLAAEFNQLHAEMLDTQQTGDSFFKSLTKAAKSRTIQFLARYLSFYDVIRYTRQAVDEIQKLDTSLVDLRKTTTMSNSELNEFYYSANDVAKELGTTTEQIISQASAWSRLGYSSKETATEMAALSSQFAAISPGMDLDLATDGLISSMKAFHIDVSEVEREVMDNINRIGNTMATSNSEIVEMLTRSSAAMNAANNTIEETIALESAAVQITRNAETTGTAFRTISMRIRGYDEETEEYIGNVEELTGAIADLTKTASTPGGISLFTDETKAEYKSTYQLLKDISAIYHDLTDEQQAALLETLAGKRGGQVLAGILDDFSEVEKAMDEMSKAAGSADDEMKIVEESISFKLNALKETWVGLLQELLDRGTIDEIIDILTKLSEAIVKIVEANPKLVFAGIAGLLGVLRTGGLKTIADTISGLGDFSKFIKGATDVSKATELVADDWLKIAAAGGDVTEAFKTSEAAMAGFGTATEGAVTAGSSLLGVLGPLVIAIAAISVGVVAWDHFTTTVEEAESELKNSQNVISGLNKEIDELNNIENRTNGQEKRLKLLQNELDIQKKILEVRQQILTEEKYGNKFSDQFDSNNVFTQYTTDKANRYEVNSNGDFVKIGTGVKENIQLMQQYQKKFEDIALSEKKRQKNTEFAQKQQQKLEKNYEKYLSEISEYQQKKDIIQADIDDGYLHQGDEAFDRAQEMLSQYSSWIRQDEAIVKDIEIALGKYDYVKDDIKSLASNWETGSISASSIADTLIDHIQNFTEAEKAAFYDSIKNAKSYAEVLDIIDGKQNEIENSAPDINNNLSWDISTSLTKYDISEDVFDKYLEVFKELNPELAKNEDLIDQVALANYRFYQSTTNLKDNLDNYIQVLHESDTSSIQYSDTLKNLSNDLSAITNIDFSLTDTNSFIKDENNLNLLKKALDGDNEALNILRENADRNIIIRIATDAHINTNEFYRQYQEVVQYLERHPGIDNIEIKSYLDNSEFIKSCNRLISEGKLTSKELTQIISNMSLKVQDSLPNFEKWSESTKKALTFTQSISDLNDLSNSLNDLGTAIANIDLNGQFQLGDLDKLADYFLGLDEAQYNVEAVSNAIKMLGEGSGSIEQQANAINVLADNYLHASNILDGVNEKNQQLYITRLNEMGIINAQAIVEAVLTDTTINEAEAAEYLADAKVEVIEEDGKLISLEGEAIEALKKSGEISNQTASQIAIFAYNKEYANSKVINTSADCKNLITLMNTAKASAEAIKEIEILKAELDNNKILSRVRKENIGKRIKEIAESAMNEVKSQTDYEIPQAKYNGGSPVKNRLGETPKSTSDAIKGVTNKAAEEAAEAAKKEAEKAEKEAAEAEKEIEDTYDEFFDYFERRVKIISNAISLLNSNLENVVGSSAKNKLLDAQQNIFQMQQREYEGAKNMYQQMADRALSKIPDDIRNNLINGAVAIDEFIGSGNKEVVEAIQDYQKWADKIDNCKQELSELQEKIRQLELTRFKNIMQDFQEAFDLRQNNAIDLINKQIALFEEAGELIGDDFYKKQKEQTERQVSAMEQARKELVAEISRGLGNGTIEIGSDEWIEMQSILSDVEGKILDCKKAIEEYDNAILNIHVNVFERIQNTFSNFSDELSDVATFLDDVDVGDKLGNWTKEGIARAGLLAQQYELAKYQVDQYQDEINWLNAQYNAGKYSTIEYMDRLAELTSRQRDAAQSAEEYKDSIIELNKARINLQIEGINDEINAYKELIDAQKKALQSAKDLHDYEKQIADANKSIVELEKQIAAMRNDDSAASIAKRKKLEQQLSDARASLAEQEYQHSIEAQEDALDKQFENYEAQREAEIDKLNEYVSNIEQVLTDTFENIKDNAQSIGETITQTAQEHGIQISDSLTTAWQAGSDAIASYGQVLSTSSSEFISNLNDVTNETWELQEQANQTSVGLADMFANRADNLVDELQRSWDSESNLDNMTHALEDSFVNTINTASGIREVVNPINEVENATNSLKDAANDAARAFDDMASAARQAKNDAIGAKNEVENLKSETQSYLSYLDEHGKTSDYTPMYDQYLHSTLQYRENARYLGSTLQRKYAKGLSNAQKDELAWTQELGDEVIISPTRSSILTPIKKGDSVIDAKGTSNLFELAKIDPQKILNSMAYTMPSTIQQNKAFGITISNLVNVEGSVNDSMAMMKIAAQQAQNRIAKTLKDLNDEIKY